MNKTLSTSLILAAIGFLIPFTQDIMYYTLNTSLDTESIVNLAENHIFSTSPVWFTSALLTGLLWQEKKEDPFWKRTILRTLIAMLLLMIASTLFSMIFKPELMRGATTIQYFAFNFEPCFMTASVYTLLWLIFPDDKPVVKEREEEIE